MDHKSIECVSCQGACLREVGEVGHPRHLIASALRRAGRTRPCLGCVPRPRVMDVSGGEASLPQILEKHFLIDPGRRWSAQQVSMGSDVQREERPARHWEGAWSNFIFLKEQNRQYGQSLILLNSVRLTSFHSPTTSTTTAQYQCTLVKP